MRTLRNGIRSVWLDSHIGAVIALRVLRHDFETAVRMANKVSAMVAGVKALH